MKITITLFVLTIGTLLSCQFTTDKRTKEHVNVQDSSYQVFTLTNNKGMTAKFCENGARIMSLQVPDKDGNPVDVVIGFEDPADYDTATEPYFGATIGRYGNRINRGKFSLEGQDYQLTINNGLNTLHGGKTGFQYKKWNLEKVGDSTLVCTLVSPDLDNGFPGNLKVKVIYTLTTHNELMMEYEATTDKTTVVNLTNHAFFNLNGSGSILNHVLQIEADQYTPVDSSLIPTGELSNVERTAFDFRKEKKIGADINDKNEQLDFGKGYDHNFVLSKKTDGPVATIKSTDSGIQMQIYTSEPGLQFYSGNFMQEKNMLRNGKDVYRSAFCLETQHFPDSPNHANFPSTVLRPDEVYHTKSTYAFSTVK
ncbi:aldose epimerase family protein [Sphingobacterium spiritivorum]|uniref:aldose epimerase family protein n=1 Tax=Sphingobacterium spiritivorum TaxID=258 RepID=UPI003DA6B5E2